MCVYVYYAYVGGARRWRGNPNSVYVYYTLVLVPVDPLHIYRGSRIAM